MTKRQDPKVKKVSTPLGGGTSKAKTAAPKKTTASLAVQQYPVSQLKPNPNNPRICRDDRFAKLKKSITEFPEMLQKRPIVAVTDVDGKLMVLGGNMRLRACQDLKLKEVHVMLADEWTEEQRRRFIIADNVGFGEHDWDMLANEWDAVELADWGLDLPIGQDFSDKNKEIDTDGFADEVTITLKYSEADHAEVREALSKVAATPEQAVWKLLKLA